MSNLTLYPDLVFSKFEKKHRRNTFRTDRCVVHDSKVPQCILNLRNSSLNLQCQITLLVLSAAQMDAADQDPVALNAAARRNESPTPRELLRVANLIVPDHLFQIALNHLRLTQQQVCTFPPQGTFVIQTETSWPSLGGAT